MGARSACRTADANGLVLRKGSRCSRNVVMFVLTRVQSEVKDGSPEEGTDDRLLKRSNDAGVDGGVHESILDSVEAVSEDVTTFTTQHSFYLRTPTGPIAERRRSPIPEPAE